MGGWCGSHSRTVLAGLEVVYQPSENPGLQMALALKVGIAILSCDRGLYPHSEKLRFFAEFL
jgi:hypothetical protein